MTTGQLIIVDHVVALLSVAAWFATGVAAATRRAGSRSASSRRPCW